MALMIFGSNAYGDRFIEQLRHQQERLGTEANCQRRNKDLATLESVWDIYRDHCFPPFRPKQVY